MTPEQGARQTDRIVRAKGRSSLSNATIAVVGLNEEGLRCAIRAAERGCRTVAFDADDVKIAQLEDRSAVFLNENELRAFKNAQRLLLTSNEKDLKNAGILIITVSPYIREDLIRDLHPFEKACEIAGRNLADDTLVIIESHLDPGQTENVALPILTRASHRSRGEFHLAYGARGRKKNIYAVGGVTNESTERAAAFYHSVFDADIVRLAGVKEAEAVRIVESAWEDAMSGAMGELAMSFDTADIDLVNVLQAVEPRPAHELLHPTANPRNADVGADTLNLIRRAETRGFDHRLLAAARRVNAAMPSYAVRQLEGALKKLRLSIKNTVIAVLGLSAHRDSDTLDGASGPRICGELLRVGGRLRIYDPYVLRDSTVRNIREALTNAGAVILTVGHSQFRELNAPMLAGYGIRIVIDACNCLDKNSFAGTNILYRGIGRGQ